MKTAVRIEHRGRESVAHLRGGHPQVQRIRTALAALGFERVAECGGRLDYRRRAALLQDDWPISLTVEQDGAEIRVRYALFIPWPWIAGFVAAIVVVLPFAGFLRADLILVVAALAVALATWKQRFDCRPDARYWQTASRRRWGEELASVLRTAAGATSGEPVAPR